jgi:hypothetical protein
MGLGYYCPGGQRERKGGVMPHGTWTTTGSGGGGKAILAVAAVVAVAVSGAAIIQALMWLFIAAAVTVILLAVAGGAIWFATRDRRAQRQAEITARWAAARQAVKDADHSRRLELARAGAPQIVIDPAVIAGALTAAVRQAQYQPEPVRVVRGQVER